jgi:DNA-binding XRE family transcriptional regulator
MDNTVKRVTQSRVKSATSQASAARARGSMAIAQDVAAMRTSGSISQEALAEEFGWARHAVSKIETGTNNAYLYDYLKMANFLRDTIPGHPAIALHDYLFKKQSGIR